MNSPQAYGELWAMKEEFKTTEGRVMCDILERLMRLEDKVELLEKA